MKKNATASTHADDIEQINEGADELASRLETLKKEAAELEARLARGTQDVTEQARRAAQPIELRIEGALRERPMGIEELARAVKESAGRVSGVLKGMRRRLFNAGTDNEPAWFWIVGDGAATGDLNRAVETLVRYRPMSFPELLAATGGRQGRVSGAIVALQRDPNSRIANLGSPMRARWFIVPEGVSVARLRKR